MLRVAESFTRGEADIIRRGRLARGGDLHGRLTRTKGATRTSAHLAMVSGARGSAEAVTRLDRGVGFVVWVAGAGRGAEAARLRWGRKVVSGGG